MGYTGGLQLFRPSAGCQAPHSTSWGAVHGADPRALAEADPGEGPQLTTLWDWEVGASVQLTVVHTHLCPSLGRCLAPPYV